MAWINTKNFDTRKGGNKNGWCLRNVREGFSIASRWPNAKEAWNNTEQHRDRDFPAADTPLFYEYGKEGHINVRFADGRIWNDGTIFANLDTYLRLRPQVRFLGWGESVNEVRVLENKPDAPQQTSIRINPGQWNARRQPALGNNVIVQANGKPAPLLAGQQYGATINGDGWANITFMGQSAWVGPKGYSRV